MDPGSPGIRKQPFLASCAPDWRCQVAICRAERSRRAEAGEVDSGVSARKRQETEAQWTLQTLGNASVL
jgi:hypothetical protein